MMSLNESIVTFIGATIRLITPPSMRGYLSAFDSMVR